MAGSAGSGGLEPFEPSACRVPIERVAAAATKKCSGNRYRPPPSIGIWNSRLSTETGPMLSSFPAGAFPARPHGSSPPRARRYRSRRRTGAIGWGDRQQARPDAEMQPRLSHSASPHPRSYFFKPPVLRREIGDGLLQHSSLPAQVPRIAALTLSPASRFLPAPGNSFDQRWWRFRWIPSRRHNAATPSSPRKHGRTAIRSILEFLPVFALRLGRMEQGGLSCTPRDTFQRRHRLRLTP